MIRVIKSGLFTTVQDEGRIGFKSFGVPVSGAADSFAYKIVNTLAGNFNNEAALEMTLQGGVFEFLSDCYAAIGGADMWCRLGDKDIANWSGFKIKKGDVLTFGYAKYGCRGYLSICGGIDVPLCMGSRSTYTRGKFGGYLGRSILNGDEINLNKPVDTPKKHRQLSRTVIPSYSNVMTLKVIMGPHHNFFTDNGINSLLNTEYKVTNRNDRMGYVLDGESIENRGRSDIISDPVTTGVIQIPKDGKPIILMADAQTTGGYPKIASVICSDMTLLAQSKSGNFIKFCSIEYSEAFELYKKQVALIEMIKCGVNI